MESTKNNGPDKTLITLLIMRQLRCGETITIAVALSMSQMPDTRKHIRSAVVLSELSLSDKTLES